MGHCTVPKIACARLCSFRLDHLENARRRFSDGCGVRNIVEFLARLRNRKTVLFREFLNTRGWTIPDSLTLPIVRVPRYEQAGAEIKRRYDKSKSIASSLASRPGGGSRPTVALNAVES